MRKVRAKFVCESKISHPTSGTVDQIDVQFRPISAMDDGPEENKIFGEYTPGGSISLSLRGEGLKAAENFKEGGEYYVDFTPVG